MKKLCIPLVAIAVCGSASSQSSVTVFGGVDVGYQRVDADGTGVVNRLINGGSLTSRLGFRGVEDLGGGWSTGFWLEAGLNGDTGAGSVTNINNQIGGNSGGGAITFNRRSTLSLMGPYGELRLGRDAVPVFWNQTIFDPFRTQGSGASINLTAGAGLGTTAGLTTVAAGRVSNSIGYLTPKNWGGFYGQILAAVGENAGTPAATRSDGGYLGSRLGYTAGPLDVAIATGNAIYAAGDVKTYNLGASYDFKVAKLMVQVGGDEREGPVYSKAKYWLLGTTVPAGQGYFRASYGRSNVVNSANDGSLAAFGYVYPLSKRTQIYSAIARMDNKGTGTLFTQGVPITRPGGSSTAFDVGIRHDF
ncbi:porin [Hydrogenophaga sp.]|uniref:porin n=1 Tax=Hydrogenophaga sp. TaxID=1904254 RepID=UPI0026105EF2|nr:porin [Hydrogenophaga sp.]MCW5653586.1 porin [Hydrogenophaga sp.]